jgi:hypothetical protein
LQIFELAFALFSVLVWIPLNIGILLNICGFIDAQLAQSQISLRKAVLGESLTAWLATMTSKNAGVPLFVLVAWICIPLVLFSLHAIFGAAMDC